MFQCCFQCCCYPLYELNKSRWVFKTLLNIYDGDFYENSFRPLELTIQSCKLYSNKYMIAVTQITNTEILALITLLVFKLLSRKVLFINRKANKNWEKVDYFVKKQLISRVNCCKIINSRNANFSGSFWNTETILYQCSFNLHECTFNYFMDKSHIDFRTQYVIMTLVAWEAITNDVLKFRKVIEFESSCIVICFSYIYLIIHG